MTYTSCKCGALLTEEYVRNKGNRCKDCERDVGSKLYWAFRGPGSATYNL